MPRYSGWMATNYIDPTPRELLERIMILEREKASLSLLVTELSKKFAELSEEVEDEATRSVSDFKYLCQHIADIHDLLHPVVDKTFPNYARDQQQINDIRNPKTRPSGKKDAH
jgi:hypothetical protein